MIFKGLFDFKNQKINDQKFSALRVGWLSNMNGEYNIEKEFGTVEESKKIEVGKFEGKVFRTNKEWFPNN